MTEYEHLIEKISDLSEKIDDIKEDNIQQWQERKDDRERLIRLDQKMQDMKEQMLLHSTCHEAECSKNHQRLESKMMNRILVAIIPITIAIIAMFTMRWMDRVEAQTKHIEVKK